LTLVAAFALALAWHATVDAPSAEAVAGRRVCLYAANIDARQTAESTAGGLTNAETTKYIGVNYTKNRSCPRITGAKRDSFQKRYGAYPLDTVQQIKCEDWLGAIKATGALYKKSSTDDFHLPQGEKDVCKTMTADLVYEFDVFKDNEGTVPKKDDWTAVHYDTTIQQYM
jgi:hypothetical protein